MSVPRNYHSIALLLQDGRVLSAGGGLCGNCAANHQDGQVYSPGYLFNPDGSPATRPVVTSAPAQADVGSTIAITGDPGIARFHPDQETRRPPTPSTRTSECSRRPSSRRRPGQYDVTLHENPHVLAPGIYMLFALNPMGTPSIARMIQIQDPGSQGGGGPSFQYVRLVAGSEVNGNPVDLGRRDQPARRERADAPARRLERDRRQRRARSRPAAGEQHPRRRRQHLLAHGVAQREPAASPRAGPRPGPAGGAHGPRLHAPAGLAERADRGLRGLPQRGRRLVGRRRRPGCLPERHGGRAGPPRRRRAQLRVLRGQLVPASGLRRPHPGRDRHRLGLRHRPAPAGRRLRVPLRGPDPHRRARDLHVLHRVGRRLAAPDQRRPRGRQRRPPRAERGAGGDRARRGRARHRGDLLRARRRTGAGS